MKVCMFKKEYIYILQLYKITLSIYCYIQFTVRGELFSWCFWIRTKIWIGSRSNLSKRPDLTTYLGNQTHLGHWFNRLKQFCKYCSFVSPKDIWETKNSLPTNTVNNKIWENRVRLYTSCITGKGKGKKGKQT